MKVNKFLIYSLLLAGSTFTSCKDDNPSIDDYWLNYEIEEVKVTQDIPVGVYLYNPQAPLETNIDQWTRITQEQDLAAGKLGPNTKPWYDIPEATEPGKYHLSADTIGARAMQKIIEWCNYGRIDFMILPGVNENANDIYPLNIGRDTAFIDMVRGLNDTLPKVELNGVKFALMINMNSVCSDLNQNNLVETVAKTKKTYPVTTTVDDPNNPGMEITQTVRIDTLISRADRICSYFKRISDYFSDPNYYHTGGRPVVVIADANKLYSSDSYHMYTAIRDTVRKHTGKEMYIIAQQGAWTPPARFHYFYLSGKVDAVTMKNMCAVGGNQQERVIMFDQFVNENYKYNKEYFWSHYNVDFVPSASPGYSQYVASENNSNYPWMPKTQERFWTMCNLAKMNLGTNPMVLIDSFNDWTYDSGIEPTDPSYGKGYGLLYLDMVKDQFKVK
ncbi:glycoside hydrolase family 99-like domain-containing protein [Coprobacter sp.]|jgi:hypothetical protein|uniref:glycoside hydrolase family 99-like domain-containing protein n=1 Tax=Coprobacter sp. TaxID=1941478 RepID=UPI003AB3D311